MPNPWLATDASTPAATRARIVRRSWEGFVDGRGQDRAVRDPIAQSWTRCRDAGVAHVGAAVAPLVFDEDEVEAQWQAHPLSRVRWLIDECLAPLSDDAHLIVVADRRGMLLWLDGPTRIRNDAEAMNFSPGTLWGESSAGTNAVGTALAADHAVQVFAAEHFHEVVQTWSCSAAPVHDPDTGEPIGVIDLTSRMRTTHPHALTAAVATARAVEMQLRCDMQADDVRRVQRFGDRVAASAHPRALVSAGGRIIVANDAWRRSGLVLARDAATGGFVADGIGADELEYERHGESFVVEVADRPSRGAAPPRTLRLALMAPDGPRAEIDHQEVPLRPRQAEILALLSTHRNGLTVERLGAELYGDHAKPSSVRVEMSRLRKTFGAWIGATPYRLTDDVECDVRGVRSLIEQRRFAEAADAHGPGLLPWSEAPGVVHERELLAAWLRQEILATDDADAVWAWVTSPGGTDDLIAWRRLLSMLPARDRRRPEAIARLGVLRARLGSPV